MTGWNAQDDVARDPSNAYDPDPDSDRPTRAEIEVDEAPAWQRRTAPDPFEGQLAPGRLPPPALAARLAGHYADQFHGGEARARGPLALGSATGPLARLHHTGYVPPGTARLLDRHASLLTGGHGELDSRGRNDPQAIAAELRALAAYCRAHDGQGYLLGSGGGHTDHPAARRPWWGGGTTPEQQAALTVPWAWRETPDAERTQP